MSRNRKIKIKIKPDPKVTAKLNKAVDEMKDKAQSKISRAVGQTVLNVDRKAKRGTPVDTGRLRSGWEIEWRKGDTRGSVFNQVKYGPKIERREGMLARAWASERPKFIRKVQRALKQLK